MTKTFLFLLAICGTLSAQTQTTTCHERYIECKKTSTTNEQAQQCLENWRRCQKGLPSEEIATPVLEQEQIPAAIEPARLPEAQEPKVIIVTPEDKELPCKRSCDRQASNCADGNGVSCSDKWAKCLQSCGGPDEPEASALEPLSICESKHQDCLNSKYTSMDQCNAEKVKCQNSMTPPPPPQPPREELQGKPCNFCTSEHTKCQNSGISEEDCYQRQLNCQKKCPHATEPN